MKTLLDKYEAPHKEKLQKTFEALNLPVPQSGEYYHRCSTLAFIAPAALVLRIQPRKEQPLLRHAHMLRPLGSLIIDETYRLDIQQGGPTNQSEEIAQDVYKRLKQDGIFTDDIQYHPNNSLLIKTENLEFPDGLPVAYDPYELRCYNRKIRRFSETLNGGNIIDLLPISDEEADDQDVVYGELREAFQNCSDERTGLPDPERINDFYVRCKDYKSKGLLSSPWERSAPLLSFIARKSKKYASQLADHNPVFSAEM